MPFDVLEAGFEDNVFGKTYQTIYLNVASQNQQSLTDETINNLKTGLPCNYSAQDIVEKTAVKIEPEFLFPAENQEISEVQHEKHTELLVAVLNGF